MEINQYAVTASEMKDLSFLDIDQYVSAGVYQSQKVPVSLVKAYMLSENIEQILLADMQALALAGDLVSLKNYLIDDGSTLYLVMAAGGVGNQIYQYAIDVTSGLFGTFDLVTGVFTAIGGVYIKDGGNNVFYSAAEQGTTSLTGNCKRNTFHQNAENNILVLDNEDNIFYQSAQNNELGDTSNSNVFGIGSSLNILADGCSNNIFEQGTENNELGSNCIGNTFKQYANGFKFNGGLQNVTIEAGTIGGNYLGVDYNFMYGQDYPATIFSDGSANYHRYYDVANDRIVVTLLTPPYTVSYIGGGAGTPDLQQVTDVNNTTTNSIIVDDGTNSVHIQPNQLKITNTIGYGTIGAANLTDTPNFELPNKPAGTETFAMLSDVSTPNIQQVLDEGNISTTAIKIDNGTGNYVQVNSSNILMEDSSGNALSVYPDSMTIQNPSFGAGTIKATALANNVTFELPNKAAGTQTFAMLSDIGAGSGTVTSVGLSMPSAFSVASSPITTSGTIAVTGAGLSSQYVRGDGSLANFPSSGGGGASVNYYLNGSVSQGTFGGVAMREVNRTPIIGTGTDFTIATNGYIQSFITDANDPNQLVIPAGNWNFETYFSASSGGGSPSFYIELHKWDGATLTLIASNSATPEAITGGTTIDLYLSAIAVPQTTLALTDRLAIRIYVNNSSRTITLHTENSHLCQVITTFTTGLTALNGLTEQVQTFAVGTSGTDFAISSASSTHTFNLPTASATNRGALSSSDWSAFNAKVSSFASATDGTASSGTSNTISISVLIPANTFALDDVIRINHRVRATGVLGIRETRVYANTSASLTGAILISTASLTSTTLAANMQRFLAIKNASTNTEVVTATTNQLTDYASFTTAVSTLLINWTVDQYIIFAVNALNGGDSIRATMYSIEKL
jgi:hypothetical protein